jgi:hypothetical protein
MEKKTFSQEISPWSKNFGYEIEENYLKIPDDKTSEFIELLMQDKPFKEKDLEQS